MLTSSPYPMISVVEALDAILSRARVLGTVEVDFREALGRVLATDVRADEDMPSGPRSAVDGYAVSGMSEPSSLRVLGELTAGQVSETRIEPGAAMRIMTGGLLPPGADAVVMVEDTSETDSRVDMQQLPAFGENVHAP